MAQETSYLTHDEKTLYSDFVPKLFQTMRNSPSNLGAMKDAKNFMRSSEAWDKQQLPQSNVRSMWQNHGKRKHWRDCRATSSIKYLSSHIYPSNIPKGICNRWQSNSLLKISNDRDSKDFLESLSCAIN